ncbi:NADH dehydrogenase subunit 5 [Alicyclobacillus mali]|uniref:NADH dehydrogenase subunit 5 n=1 Tax=Alicyclobacillus mali (ex Roth et al. 2021) TaxID=1123961 RepID=A0ABS0F5N7_9BACL|nr:NADH dehydrogenase subunit 5 [Alicyclobacillus mali (ex Roth et al. 2021)]MBF8378592.1 NADH dehydrogenase subunit 5 [Alicyclobacillus mali (ex Roth et al. 2021)]MCL6488373.1 NADH dehydrogenase subunit 5 [Alicyclobacillus mali (ex Roth et al. 2021)]
MFSGWMPQIIFPAWLVAWAFSGLAAGLCLRLRGPQRRVGLLLGGLALVAFISLAGLVFTSGEPYRDARLGWAVSAYIAALGLGVEAFAMRHLAGSERYGRYFAWMTWTLFCASASWMVDNAIVFAVCWIGMDVGIVRLISLQRGSRAVRRVVRTVFVRLLRSMGGIALISLLCVKSSGRISLHAGVAALAQRPHVAILASLVLAVVALAQAGNAPFMRWLLDSAITPTPVSALMHAGVVNAGGLLLAKFAPVLATGGIIPRALLMAAAWVSIAIGTGILMIHADYKRQLVASTMAQMGLMLTECAVGAYAVAMVHLVLHGVFKATLFLRSGSAVPRPDEVLVKAQVLSPRFPWAQLVGAAFFLVYAFPRPADGLSLLSGLLLGAGCAVALAAATSLRAGRWLGAAIALFAGALALALRDELIRAWAVLLGTPGSGNAWLAAVAAGLIALHAALLTWLRRHPRHPCSLRAYAWLAHMGDPSPHAAEAQPAALETLAKEAMLS